MSRSFYGRIERDEIRSPSPQDLWAIAAVLGLDLRLTAYPAGEPVHDRVQLPMLELAHNLVAPGVPWLTEVTLPIGGDRRAWDAVAMTPDGWTAFEAISRLGAVDATMRRANEKLRDDPRVARLVLVINDTARNREAMRVGAAALRSAFPLGGGELREALRNGRHPALHGIVMVRPRRRP
jgi:transcriptional regulator with XRE-family HTH domain